MENEENNEDADNQEETKACANCRRRIGFAADLWCVEQAVMGPRGVVPLGEILYFCSKDCIGDFYDSGREKLGTMPRRIP